jgi:hypothetical protein
MPVFRMDSRSADSLPCAPASAVWLTPDKLAIVSAVLMSWLVLAEERAAASGLADGPAGTVVGAVGSLIQRASLKTAVASGPALASPLAVSSAVR